MRLISKILFIFFMIVVAIPGYADGVPGKFDYYVLSLSWSPEHCAEVKSDKIQCAGQKHYGFVVHGLWPQYEKGYPDTCSTTPLVPQSIVQEMLPIMPSEKLIQHEWEKHGTCSGKQVDDYFGLVKSTYIKISIPAIFLSPDHPVNTSATQIRQQFMNSNSGLNMAVICKGKFLQEIRLCYDKGMQSMACGADVNDDCPSSIVMRPVR